MNANELKTMRSASGLSQHALEKQCGISRTYISLYENDRMKMTEEHANRLEQALIHHITSNDDEYENTNATIQTAKGFTASSDLDGDEFMLLENEYQLLRKSICERLNEAPEGIFFRFDDDKREEIELEVLTDIARAFLLIDDLTGHEPLIPLVNPDGSVGQSLRARLTSE